MGIITSWLRPPTAIGGLDHLGTQAPCVYIYSRLLPGITNVTDRARYYSFYPWLIWSFERQYPKEKDHAFFLERYRRADCLFTLIAERHSRQTDNDDERHGSAMVGRRKLIPALSELEDGQKLKLTHFTTDSPDGRRYFQNPFGGLGQYYSGTLADLGIIDARSSEWFRYTNERGKVIAEAFDQGVDADAFWKACEADTIALERLDALKGFCPCHLQKNATERQALTDLFFNAAPFTTDDGDQRRSSLGLVLDLVTHLDADAEGDIEGFFRGCCYSGSTAEGNAWTLSPALERTRAYWAVYQRADMLSLCFQGLFAYALLRLQEWPRKVRSVVDLVAEIMGADEVRKALTALPIGSFGNAIKQHQGKGPPISHWRDADHEVQAADAIWKWGRQGATRGELLLRSARCLIALASRTQVGEADYGGVGLSPEALIDYPINVLSFEKRVAEWVQQPVEQVIGDMLRWSLDTHLRVALRKLRQTSQSSFRFTPTDFGLEVVDDVPLPGYTLPRFNESLQILRDIGMVVREKGLTRLNAVGKTYREKCGG